MLYFISNSLREIFKIYKCNTKDEEYSKKQANKLIKNVDDGLFKNRTDGWNFPMHKDRLAWHITTYYEPYDNSTSKTLNRDYYHMNKGRKEVIDFNGIIFIPDNIITAFSLNNEFFSFNPLPNMTCLYGKHLRPKNSDDIMKYLFSNKSKFDVNNIENYKGKVFLEVININGYYYNCFVYFFENKESLIGEMSSFRK